jgi:hypothetical protein
MVLDPRTEELLRDFFMGKCCRVCNQPAVRAVRQSYYCESHFPYRRHHSTGVRKVYSHPQVPVMSEPRLA